MLEPRLSSPVYRRCFCAKAYPLQNVHAEETRSNCEERGINGQHTQLRIVGSDEREREREEQKSNTATPWLNLDRERQFDVPPPHFVMTNLLVGTCWVLGWI